MNSRINLKLRVIIFSVLTIMFFTACETTNNNATTQYWLPSQRFGSTVDEIKLEVETQGFQTTFDSEKRQLTAKSTKATNLEIIYYFDDKNKYRYAMSKFANTEDLNSFVSNIQKEGFALHASASKSPEERVYISTVKNVIIAVSTSIEKGRIALSYSFGPIDETIFSWTRTQTLSHTSGLWLPLIANGLPLDMVQRFETRLQHTFNRERSKIDKGIYYFNTGNARFPYITYWLDDNTKTYLDEAAIFIDPNNRPTPAEVDNFLTSNGFKLTPLVDENNNQVYYNREYKYCAWVGMNKPAEGGTFTPKIQFYHNNIDDRLPFETVNFPMPVVEFGTLSMEQAIDQYKAKPYYQSHTDDVWRIIIYTTSKDFPEIWIFEGDGANVGKYYAAILTATDTRVINSPNIPEILIANGYEKKNVSILPTYINYQNNTMAQIDHNGTFGALSVAFSPNEF